MKKLLPLMMIAVVMFASSCKKDDDKQKLSEVIIGAWNTSDGGTITFVADRTGTTSGSASFEMDLGNGPVADFTWSLANENYLTLNFEENGNTGTIELPVDLINTNEIHMGVPSGFAGVDVTLTR